MDLLECRNKLDVIDKQIVKLFEERMDICGKVAETTVSYTHLTLPTSITV